MEFILVGKKIKEIKGNALVIGVYKELSLTPIAQEIDSFLEGKLIEFLKDIDFKGELEKTVFMPVKDKTNFKYLIITGLGEKEKLEPDKIRKASASALKKVEELKLNDVTFENLGSEQLGEKAIQWLVEGVLLSNYKFKKYKKDNEKTKIEKINLLVEKKWQKSIQIGKYLAEAANFTRDLVNEPGNVIKPQDLAEIAIRLAKEVGLKCIVYDEKKLKDEKMHGILAVGQGSYHPPRFIHLAYTPSKAKKRFVIIGKGITFDSGGLNIKPDQFMKTMKSDKAGACAVLGIMKAIASLKPQCEVHGLIPAAENMPGGKAFRPDDIIVFKNGKSVEIHNTDAEGRLILADALIYASELKPDVIIDMATLTGACIVALGRFTSGIFSNDENLTKDIQEIGKETGEKFWPLPLDEDLKEEIKGTFGDIKNVGSRYGGAITAALFLKEFVEVKHWIHLDIAGPAYLEKSWKYYVEGATGVPVRTVLTWLLKEANYGFGD
ncbi:MAG: leucyl aminopeptidase [Candidatus Desulfofervidus auxilii]|nr:leucyl aminopeptidase [Candidatus Desulfofervidus auxilii]